MQDNISRFTENDIHDILTKELGVEYFQYRKEWDSINPKNFPNFPLHIDFEMQDRCNQSCVMCPRNHQTHPDINYKLNKKTNTTFENFKKVIDEGKDNGLKSINLGAFAEPLINDDVFRMIRYAKNQGGAIVDIRIITNGLKLGEYIDEILDCGLVNLFVSVDAFSDETYRKIRGYGFETVKSNLQLLLQKRAERNKVLPITRVSFVDMMGRNSNEKENFIAFWKDKVDFIDIQIFDDYNVDINKDYDFSKKKKWQCFSPFSRVAILSNGDILPCCNFFGRNIPIGNINKTTVKEAWNSDFMSKIRTGVFDDSIRNCAICQRIGD
ncbi:MULTISPECIES: radical SAM/SPASM domain-containing protein [unclassified Campylobacter]|uniref:radical SAM/SPASM domain-containing protein n=1 Tax=unclassified Campylobacter TaxID=2593542 RepID=UPI003D324C8C